jgi:small subunit ribosomal protein S6
LAIGIYEGFYLFDSNRYARDPNSAASTIQDAITNLGGEILISRLWAEQKLAYPIKGHQKGTYWLIYFKLETTKLTELNRGCQLNESLMRWLFTTIDARLIDALVAHAQGIVPHTDREEKKPVLVGAAEEDEEESEEDEES